MSKSKVNISKSIYAKTVLSLCFLFFLGCTRTDSGNRANKLSAEVAQKPLFVLSILPQEYFARRIGGGMIDTMVLAGPGQNPHSYEPAPRQMQDLAQAKAWILSGTEFEIGLYPKISVLFPNLKIIDGTEGVHFRSLEAHEDYDYHFDDEDDSIDRHSWLGYEGASIMAYHIRDTLCAADPDNALLYRENCAILAEEMKTEFEKLKKELDFMQGRTVLVYHPAFGYFLDEFEIIQEAVETGGKEPSPRVLAELIEKAKMEKIRLIFVQAQFPAASAQTVASAIGAELYILDPLAPDWLANIVFMGEALKQSALRE